LEFPDFQVSGNPGVTIRDSGLSTAQACTYLCQRS